ncbi:MAG: archease [Dehalococcoidales bacterium]|nr:archease [Dehalococcoidales bacterium]
MERFELIEHTADLGIRAWGSTLAESFANAAYGMFSIMADLDGVVPKEVRELEVEGDDWDSLLFEWLNSLLYYFDVEGMLFKEFEITELAEKHLRAVCRGEVYDPARHRLKTGVKSATYYMLKVDTEKNEVQVIFDV